MCRTTYRFTRLLPEIKEKTGIEIKSARTSRSDISRYAGVLNGKPIHGLLNVKEHVMSVYDQPDVPPKVLHF